MNFSTPSTVTLSMTTEFIGGPTPRFCSLVFGQDSFNPNVEAFTQSFSSASTTDISLSRSITASSAYARSVKCR